MAARSLRVCAAACALLAGCADAMFHGGRYRVTRDVFNEQGWAELGVFGYSSSGVVEVDVVDKAPTDNYDIRNITRWTAQTSAPTPAEGGGMAVEGQPPPAPQQQKGISFFILRVGSLGASVGIDSKEICGDAPPVGTKENPIHELNWHYVNVTGKVVGRLDFRERSNGLPPGFWALIMYQCPPDADYFSTWHVEVQVNEFNLDAGKPNYLQVGDQWLPYIYLFGSIVFAGLLVKWFLWMREFKEQVLRIHWFMAVALFLKAGSLFFESTRYYYYKDHGNNSALRDFMYFAFMSLKGTLLFAMIVLIGTGWSFLKPFLHPRDKKILLIVIPLQIVINIMGYAVDHLRDGDPKWKYWQEKLSLLNLISCGLVMVPIAWSVRQFRNASEADGKVAKNLQRMKQFRTLYAAMVVYVYFKTIICDMVLVGMVGYQWTWLPPTLTEISVAACFVFVGLKFRPMRDNPYTTLDEEDLVEGGRALEMELDELERERRDIEAANQPYDVGGAADEPARSPAPAGTGLKAVKRDEADF